LDPQRTTFASDFRRFFLRGLGALLPTLITLWLLVWAWNFLWFYIGQHLIWPIKFTHYHLAGATAQWGDIDRFWDHRLPWWVVQLTGVTLAIVLVYIVGLLVGNLIGRTFWKIGERLAMKVPVVRAIYPAVKQVTDFFLNDRKYTQFAGSRVVAIQPHQNGIWSLGLITGSGPSQLAAAAGDEVVTVFCPNSPAAFSGYVMAVPRNALVELPISVEEAMRLFVSGGVIMPGSGPEGKKELPPTAAPEFDRKTPSSPEIPASLAPDVQRRAG
jgi:uncharacterized membrane protein